ncbi:hypothetical protein Tco_1315973 [Tanacetum coccineum]
MIMECSSCGALYNKSCGCSKGGLVDKFVRDPNKTSDSSQRPPIVCVKCGNPVEGPSCQGCALWRKKLKEVWFTTCHENGINQDLLNTFESFDDDTNIVNAPREPFVVKQYPGENSSQSPPQINHNCCYECGDSLDGILCQQCTYFHDLCCENCEGPHKTFQCQLMNEDYYHEQNPCYDSNSFGFDQFQPQQYTVNHPIFNAQNSLLNSQNEFLNSQNEFLNSQNKLMDQMTSMCDMVGQFIQKKEEEKRIEEEQAAKDRYWKIPVCYDDDDDEESSIPLKDIIIAGLPSCVPITPVLFTKEPVDSLIMEDEHLDTILETESDELIKSSVENIVQIPSESEDSSEGECDLPPYDDSSKNHDLTFSNPLFDIDEDFTSSDESFSEEDVPNVNFKIFSNPLFDLDEEITFAKIDQIDDEVLENTNSIPPGIEYPCFNAESDLLESLLHRDTSINDSQKIDSLLDKFAGELTFPHSIPPGIDDVNLDPEGDILFLESLLYDNSSPHPLEEFNSENPTESFSPSPIPVEDSDSLMEEIDIFFDGDDSIPPGIESDDFDSEDDDNSTFRPEFESFNIDYPDSGDSTIDVVEDIPVDVPNILPTHPALQLDFEFIPSNDLGSDLNASSPSGDSNKIYYPGICIKVEATRFLSTISPMIDTLLLFSSENEDKVFNHGVLASKEKSPSSLSHRGFKASKLFHQKSPMLISGDNTPNLGVRHPHFYPP